MKTCCLLMNAMTMHFIAQFIIHVLIVTVPTQAQLNFGNEPSEFNVVLTNMITRGYVFLSENEHVKKASTALTEELMLIQSSVNKGSGTSADISRDDWASTVDNLLDTVESLLGGGQTADGAGSSKSSQMPERVKRELVEFFGEFDNFKKSLAKGRVEYNRFLNLFAKFLSVMSRRPLLRKNVAKVIEGLEMISAKTVDIEEMLNFVSQIVGVWNAPMGQSVIKPMLDNIYNNLISSDFDIKPLKPMIETMLNSVLGKKTLNQIKPMLDLGFMVAENIIYSLKRAGLDKLFKNFQLEKFTKKSKNVYFKIFLDAIRPLEEVIKSNMYLVKDVDNVYDVTDRYRNVPGTLDAKYKKMCIDNPLIKVKSIVTHMERAAIVMKESKNAIKGLAAYPLKHPAQAIESVNNTIIAMDVGNRILKDLWPLGGYLRYHVVVKSYHNIRKEIAAVRSRLQAGLDKTYKFQNLINHVKDMSAIFDLRDVFNDVRAILVHYPKYDNIVYIMDMLFGEFLNFKQKSRF